MPIINIFSNSFFFLNSFPLYSNLKSEVHEEVSFLVIIFIKNKKIIAI